VDFVAENSNWVWKEKSEPSTCLYICVCVREHIFIGNVFTLGPTAQAALVYIKTKLNSKNKPEKPKKKAVSELVPEIFAGFQAFTWRTCPLALGYCSWKQLGQTLFCTQGEP